MKVALRSFQVRRRLAASVPGFLCALVMIAGAAPEASALTDDAIRCRDLVATSARYGASVVMKARSECVRKRASGNVSLFTDCQADPVALGGTGSGDARVDLKVLRVLATAKARSRRLINACTDTNPDRNVVPSDILDPASACGAFTDWADVGECAVELGKQAADSVHELLDVLPAFAPLPDGDVECIGATTKQARKTLFSLNLWRAKCFRTDDKLADGGGVYECDANITPPGAFNSTGWLRADKRLRVPAETLGVVLYRNCDKDLAEIGFEAITPNHSGGDWATRITLDDVFDSLNDRIAGAVTRVMAELFPVGGYCGDGNLDPGEQCDDGNHLSNDGCDRDCSLPSCGNGAINGGNPPNLAGEECDDGNNADGDGCTFDCKVERCGNGIVNPGWAEECDDGGESAFCDLDCTFAACGDGYLNMTAGEQCDWGAANNSNLPDTCGNGAGPSLRGACQLPFCQDGVVDTGEICDDGGESFTCDTNCTPASCGDGDLNATRGETCDDGNASDNDSCPSSNPAGAPWCLTATCGDGFTCSDVVTCTSGPFGGPEACDDAGPSATCDADCSLAVCGDGTLNPLNVTPPATAAGEACDDGNLVDGDGCDSNCTVTACGNGVVTAGEFCDDGNLVDGDGCDSDCTPTGCGNGIVTAGEACDDAGESPTCNGDCTFAVCGDSKVNASAGEQCDTGGDSMTCNGNCTFSTCGDGYHNAAAGEACDDGNLVSGDGCDSNCTATACGNGIVTAGEQCDDGNLINGDGCNSSCQFE